MRGAPSSESRRGTVTPRSLLLVAVGMLALTFIVISPSLAKAQVFDEAGTASLDRPPVVPTQPDLAGSGMASQSSPKSEAVSSSVTGGGIGVPGVPRIQRMRCLRQCVSQGRATRGAIISIRGENLERVSRVIFTGRERRIRVKWRSRSRGDIRVTVPKKAVGGPVIVVDTKGRRARSPGELRVMPLASIPTQVFPVRGAFSFGSEGSRFGAGRDGHSHQGQDLAASCGTRLVSIRKARVLYNQWDDGGGYYVVLKNLDSNTSFVYMHMQRRSPVKVGQIVRAGAPIGTVGNTGRSFGCHLHFEFWAGAWQTGGKPIDPLRFLKSLLKDR